LRKYDAKDIPPSGNGVVSGGCDSGSRKNVNRNNITPLATNNQKVDRQPRIENKEKQNK
jgi:hypothetical protein